MSLLLKVILFSLLLSGLTFSRDHSEAEIPSDQRINQEIEYMKQAMAKDQNLTKLINQLGDENVIKEMLERFYKGKKKAEQEWRKQQSSIQKMRNLGKTESLEILPLIDSRTGHENLKGENGVSYLVKTDKRRILFDLGLNEEENHPSPLLHNMKQLGISLDDFDTIVISHNHGDHVGGDVWSLKNTFSLTSKQIDLGEKKVFTPVPMNYPNLEPICSKDPSVIEDGVATIGVITSQLFVFGEVREQALAVNVEGKGIVLVVGCGHQTLKKILDRAEILFDTPIYGVIGGLHYPVNDTRLVWKGIKLMYLGTGKVPWRPITMEELHKTIDLLKEKNPGVVALSPHDSSEAAMETFREAFPEAYQTIEVGKKIIIREKSRIASRNTD